jgi:eukaryotic-like serine/threonine-protein kinase
MLTKSGAKLLDFGLAKSGVIEAVSADAVTVARSGDVVTARGTILGTFQYMAPEQIEGGHADERSDIFALGTVLYEMLTGRKAFQGSSEASVLSAILKDDPPPVSQFLELAPPALDSIVRACLAKDPDARVQSAHDLWLQFGWLAEGASAPGN